MLQFIWKNYLSLVKTPNGSWFSKSPEPRAKSESPHSVTKSVMSGKSPQLTTSIPAPWLLRPLLALRAESGGFSQDHPEPHRAKGQTQPSDPKSRAFFNVLCCEIITHVLKDHFFFPFVFWTFIYLCTQLCGMWDPSFAARDQTEASCSGTVES